jgi:hypothetical protein
MSNPFFENRMNVNRRHFLGKTAIGLGSMALGSLMIKDFFGEDDVTTGLPIGLPHFAPKAKRIIYLFQNGAPSQLETFDYKPKLNEMFGQDLPASIRDGQRLTGMTANQERFPLVGSNYKFSQFGKHGAWVSEIFPNIGSIADDICIIRSMHTEAINHDPALTFMQTGAQQGNRPSMGSWLSYGLGSENQNLPSFCVLLSRGKGNGQGVYSKLWSNGFLDSVHQGVQFSNSEDRVLYLSNQSGMTRDDRRKMLDVLNDLNEQKFQEVGDPDIRTKIENYELAYRMQTAVPEITDLSKEPESIIKLYGADSLVPGTFASNCLLARKLSESGVRFIQLYHQGWDAHDNLPTSMRWQATDVDRASAGLVKDLKQRGLLDETLVIWGGEFGRTNYCQGKLAPDNYGRDHHPRAYSIWMAGGGIKPGMVYGETDEFGYNIIENPVHVNDFHATILHQMGLDHEKLVYKHLGRRYRLTDVAGKVIKDILA